MPIKNTLAQLEQWKIEKIWSLSDLEDMKNREKFNEYVTKENIDEWIRQQKSEIDAITRWIEKEKGKLLGEAKA
jgi:hypothetical protein